MWYRIVKAQIGGGAKRSFDADKQIQNFGIDSEKLHPELIKLLEDMDLTVDDYCNMTDNVKKSLWDIIINKVDTNLYNSVNDSDTPVFEAVEARRHSDFHDNPEFTPLESQLESARHNTVNEPNNMLQAEKGRGGMFLLNGNGFPQYSSGKGDPIFMDNLPSSKRLV